MSHKVGLKKVLQYMNVGYATLNNLMREHPKPEEFDSSSMRGHRFPDAHKNGRELLFDVDEVRQWCSDNAEFYRQRKPKLVRITMPKRKFLQFLGDYKPSPHGDQVFDEHLDRIDAFERDKYLMIYSIKFEKDEAILEFDNADDAVWFKMKYA